MKAMDDRMSTALFRLTFSEQLKGDAYKLIQDENTEMLISICHSRAGEKLYLRIKIAIPPPAKVSG